MPWRRAHFYTVFKGVSWEQFTTAVAIDSAKQGHLRLERPLLKAA